MASTKAPNHELSPLRCPVTLDDVELFEPGAQEHWFEAYEILHREQPIVRIPGEGTSPDTDGFVLTKYQDIADVVADPVTFPQPFYGGAAMASAGGNPSSLRDAMARNTLRPTLELHKAHRVELTDPWVGAIGAPRHRPMVTRFVDQLIDNWIDKGEVEFVSEFAQPLPQLVMTTILGFPLEDMPKLKVWGEAQVRRFVYGKGHRNLMSPEEEMENARDLGEFMAYVAEQVAYKRQHPGDDMTSFLTQVTYRALDRKLTDQEVIGVIFGMHIGGLETTQYALTAEAELLADNPALFAGIRADRSKIRFFVEEGLRIQAPTQGLSTRMAAKDVEIRGVPIPAGSILHLRYGAGNRDPEQFECPEEVRLSRPAVGRHLTFSQGLRVCPGAGISRLEQNIAWERLSERIESLRFAPGKNDFTHQPGIMLGLWKLHLSFTKDAAASTSGDGKDRANGR
jgi:cytochrome P450